jgi:SpoVK/Ycf46/Vps4 family AAA+-type ATPase
MYACILVIQAVCREAAMLSLRQERTDQSLLSSNISNDASVTTITWHHLCKALQTYQQTRFTEGQEDAVT